MTDLINFLDVCDQYSRMSDCPLCLTIVMWEPTRPTFSWKPSPSNRHGQAYITAALFLCMSVFVLPLAKVLRRFMTASMSQSTEA